MEDSHSYNNETEAMCMKLEYEGETHEATNGNLSSVCEKSSVSINETHSTEAITKTSQPVQIVDASTTHATSHANNPITPSSSESSLTGATSSESETSIDSDNYSDSNRETLPVSRKRKISYAQTLYFEQLLAVQKAKLEKMKQYFLKREEMLELRFKQKEEIKEKRHQEKMKRLDEILQKMRD